MDFPYRVFVILKSGEKIYMPVDSLKLADNFLNKVSTLAYSPIYEGAEKENRMIYFRPSTIVRYGDISVIGIQHNNDIPT